MNIPHIIIGISGASGALYGIRLLEALKPLPIHVHLVISKAGAITITQETNYSLSDVHMLADKVHNPSDIGASIASGSFHANAMIIAPCSIKTMSAIATGFTDNLLSRAADVCLKERKKLILMVRETPFHLGHLRTMTQLAEIGAIIAPPLPALYAKPSTIDEMIQHTIGHILHLAGIPNDLTPVWEGIAP